MKLAEPIKSLLPDEAELERILRKEKTRDEVAEWNSRVTAAKRVVTTENLE